MLGIITEGILAIALPQHRQSSGAVGVRSIRTSGRRDMLGDKSHKHLEKVGFTPIESANSLFWHDELKLLLIVYVDDFRMSGPKESMDKGWKLIRSELDMDHPVTITRMSLQSMGSWYGALNMI